MRGLSFSDVIYYVAKAIVWITDFIYFFALIFSSKNLLLIAGIFVFFLLFQTIELALALRNRKEMEKVLEGDMVSEAAKFFYLPALFLLFYFLFASEYEILFAFALAVVGFLKMCAYLVKRYYAERSTKSYHIKKRRLL